MTRAVRIRIAVHVTVLVLFLAQGIFCLTPAGHDLANSVAYVTFLSTFAITYTAASSLEALHAGRKADPNDPAGSPEPTRRTRPAGLNQTQHQYLDVLEAEEAESGKPIRDALYWDILGIGREADPDDPA